MKRRNMATVMQGAALLSVASLIAKILSAVYRVPFQNMVGNTGFYVYQQVYPIYGIGMTIALSGLPMFISKLTAETPNVSEQRGTLRQVMVLLGVFSLAIFLGLQVFSLPIAVAMGDAGLTPIIQSVSWMFLFAPFLSVSRGFFQGHFNMVPTALSQLIEQVIRVSVILTVAYIAMRHHWNVYRMGSWAMSSATFAALCASAVMGYYWWRSQRALRGGEPPITTMGYGQVAKRVLIEGGTISLLASMMVLLQLVDSFSVMKGLMATGLPGGLAKALKGVFDRGQPLVQLGLVVATAFASSLLPSLTGALRNHRQLQFERLAKTVLRISLVISTAAAVGMIALMPQMNYVLFGDTAGSEALDVYVLSVVFATVITILNSILQSLNRYSITVIALLGGVLAKIVINKFLVIHMGIVGASWATFIALIVMTGILMQELPALRPALVERGFWTKLVITSGLMLLGVRFVVLIASPVTGPGRLASLGVIAVGVIVGVGLFIWLALKTKLLTTREWLMVPYVPAVLRWVSGRQK